MLPLPFIKPDLLLGHVSLYLFDKISLCFPQGPDNADVFMTPNEEDTQQISEEVLKESKVIQEEIESLLSEVCLCNCKYHFCTFFCFDIVTWPLEHLVSFMSLDLKYSNAKCEIVVLGYVSKM
jgi:hypothetical protein